MILMSYGLSKGKQPLATKAYSAAGLPNPHTRPELRALDGRDERVQHWLRADSAFYDLVTRILGDVTRLPKDATVAVGCWGGRHRSVAVVEEVAWKLEIAGIDVRVKHRELEAV